jgi:hypothetical protein
MKHKKVFLFEKLILIFLVEKFIIWAAQSKELGYKIYHLIKKIKQLL